MWAWGMTSVSYRTVLYHSRANTYLTGEPADMNLADQVVQIWHDKRFASVF